MGYLDMEEETLKAFGGKTDGENCRLHSGDLGRRNDRGMIHVEGRIKGQLTLLWAYNPQHYTTNKKDHQLMG